MDQQGHHQDHVDGGSSIALFTLTGSGPVLVDDMTSPRKDELLALFQQWAASLGYLTGKIDLTADPELAGVATADCSLTAHAPLWGTKAGQEKPMSATTVRKTLAANLKFVRIERHDMHMAVHDTQICFFFVVKAKLKFFPLFSFMTVPLAFVLSAVDTPQGLRIREINEWPAASPEEAQRLLVAKHGWPETTRFEKKVAFGALS